MLDRFKIKFLVGLCCTATVFVFAFAPSGDDARAEGTKAESAEAQEKDTELTLAGDIKPFLANYCVECHGEKVKKARFAVHDITEDNVDHWERIVEMVSLEDMPPRIYSQPSREERDAFVAWVNKHLIELRGEHEKEQTPNIGNRVRHEDLFSGEFKGPAYSPARMWRISQHIYDRLSSELGGVSAAGDPRAGNVLGLMKLDGEGFKDYDILRADDAVVRAMMLNFRTLAVRLTLGAYIGSRDDGKGGVIPARYDTRPARLKNLKLLTQDSPGPEAYDEAVRSSFKLLLSREPNEEEFARYRGLLVNSVKASNPIKGCQNLLMGILFSPEFIFRMELGTGKDLGDGRRMLGPEELAYAIAYTLQDGGPDGELNRAVKDGRLSTREDVEREVRRILDLEGRETFWSIGQQVREHYIHKSPLRTRLLRFFQEFFGYTHAKSVFKDSELNRNHMPVWYVLEADNMVVDIIRRDQRVFETLLTTDRFVVGYVPEKARESRRLETEKSVQDNPGTNGWLVHKLGGTPNPGRYDRRVLEAFGFGNDWDYSYEQPMRVENRVGILTHPAWLVAWSGNFDNDIIRRGKWIREHLLAGVVPDLPIGVDVDLPAAPEKTLRQKLDNTKPDECWRCHRHMNDLGMAFEAYDHFGRYRHGTIGLGDHAANMKLRHDFWKKRSEAFDELAKLEANELLLDRIEKRIAEQKPPIKGSDNYDREMKIYEHSLKTLNHRRNDLLKLSDDERHKRIAELKQIVAQTVPPKPEQWAPVDASGLLTGTGDPELDGPYEDVHDLMHRLAKSDRVRQSILRHMFRYFMGRNETLDDSPTLMAMDKAYVDSNGSFKEAIVALMTSDSFLTRRNKD